MKCFNEDLLQSYIDCEVPEHIEEEIKGHIAECSDCANKVSSLKEQISFLKGYLYRLDPPNISIPDFRYTKKRKKLSWVKYTSVAAAILLVIFMIFNPLRSKDTGNYVDLQAAEMLIHEFLDGEDPNQLWHDKIQINIIESKDGEMIIKTSDN